MFKANSIEKTIIDNLVKYYPRNSDGRINLNQLVLRENIAVKMMPDIFKDALGQFIERGPDGRPTIYLNTGIEETQQRFVLAHELGHYFLSHGSCVRDTVKQIEKRDPYEISSNKFANELLMPEKIVFELVRKFLPIKDMAERFRVSEHAMRQRLKSLGL